MAPVPADSIYPYVPSRVLAIIAAAVFFVLAVLHFLTIRSKRCGYFWPVVIAGLMECFGYIVRIPSGNKPDNIPLYAAQLLLILLPPLLVAATIYMTLGRLLRFAKAEDLSLVPVKWLTGIFVSGDIGAFLAQCAGGAMEASKNLDTEKRGTRIAEIGLGVQLLFFSFFIVVSIISHYRLSRYERQFGRKSSGNWRRVMLCLYISSVLILIRSVFRLIQFVTGSRGTIASHEWTLYAFDALPMAIALAVLQLLHPAFVIVSDAEPIPLTPPPAFEESELGSYNSYNQAWSRN